MTTDKHSRVRPYRVGVDIGGTFTDLLLVDDASGAHWVAKTLTTPADPSAGVEQALRDVLAQAGVAPAAVRHVVHGTTLATNAIIERTGARVALVTTRGFADVLDIAREHRYDMHDVLLRLPTPLVPRERRFEIDERVLADGTVEQAPDPAALAALATTLGRHGVEAVAVCLLHAYQWPAHERQVGAVLAAALPGVRLSLSHEVAGEIREYERTSTTVANAYVQPVMEQYLARLAARLAALGLPDGALLIMLSNGGLATVATASRFPVRAIESGPAAGALAAADAGRRGGRPNLLSFDMGGTTAKACLIADGRPGLTSEFEVDRVHRFARGSGLPIRAPAIEMIEIGAGGGSIARVDSLGLLRVGPDSAGADPGPACYGRGGAWPTVTDADLLLGYLDPGFFLGGAMRLDRAAAERAIGALAAHLDRDSTATAWGIHRLVNESMAGAARMHCVEHGQDPRAYPLFAFGGAGPVHAYRVAELLGSRTVIVPPAAGVGSTAGFLAAPLAFDLARGLAGRLDRLDLAAVATLYTDLEADGAAILRAAGVPAGAITVTRSAEMRLAGQAHQIAVPVPDGPLDATDLAAAFAATYATLYRRAAPAVAIEAVTWRARVSGPTPVLVRQPPGRAGADPARKGERLAYLPEQAAFGPVAVYDRYRLAPGARVDGPAIVEERECTVVIGPSGRAEVDAAGNLVIAIG
ncbi:MAG: hydantoinase/oxoprolinase family protein [Chloroflexi bacterium]|nr:hydantoinase/oxoprolinase family protein [Chloroflexota bacterium]